MPVPFLLEIGCEEIPDWMIVPALKHLEEALSKLIADHNLGGSVSWTDATPRRLIALVDGLIERQADAEEIVTGPPKTAGEGAVAGFAKKMGVARDVLKITQTAKGEYYSVVKSVQGRETSAILAEALPGLIGKIYFPKTMYWAGGKSGFRFIRPIRWLVALLGDSVVPFTLAGVRSGNITRGHRKLGSSAIPVTIASYRDELRRNFVLAMASERRAKIRSEIKKLGVRVKADAALLETLVYITEYPAVIKGDFDEQFLQLPSEVLVTVMRHHQKYFSIEDEQGNLAPGFVAVMNTASDPEGLVKKGNERVLRARFNDARFFYQNDQTRKLADRVLDLEKVTFQAKLGSYLEKAHRVVDLVQELGGSPMAERAALLAKCDLTTEMVKEFTDLQGIVGGLYAKVQGEPEEVWRAIYEHYKPLSMDDSIPATAEGRYVAIADKLDTLRGYFEIGMAPSGSKDPFALRRAAQGVVKILVEGRMRLPLSQLAGHNETLKEFFLDRVRYYFKEVRGFAYDEVNAVLKAGSDDLRDVEDRLKAVQAVRPTANFEPLAAAFKRIQNILKQANATSGGRLEESLLEPGAERELYERFQVLREAAGSTDYRAALEAIASIRPQVDLFFDKVLVNAPDEAVRANRLRLLGSLLTEFSTIADFSEIVTSKQ